MSRERRVPMWRRVASVTRFGVVALAVGLLVTAMLGALVLAVLVALAVIARGCHTIVGGYLVEGHVPLAAIDRLLS